MMDYDKIYERIVRRGDEILEQRRKKAAMIKQTSYAVSGLCAAAIVGVGVWRLASSTDLTENNFPESNIVNDIESTTTEAVTVTGTTAATTNKQVTSVSTATAANKTETTKATSKSTTAVTAAESTHTTAVTSETTGVTNKITTNAISTECTRTSAVTSQTATAKTTQTTVSTTVRPNQPEVTTTKGDAAELIPHDITNLDIYGQFKIDDGTDPDTGETIYRKFFYSPCSVDKEILDELLYEKHIESEYYDPNDKVLKTGETDVKIYSIKQTSSKAVVAVKFKDEDKYYVYYVELYRSESLSGLISDLALSSEGLGNSVYIAKVNKWSKKLDTEKVWDMLTENTDITNDYEYCNKHGITAVAKISFSYTSPYISAINGSIGVSQNGYIITNIGRSGSWFYIGEDKAKEIIDYVMTYINR